jgi:Ca-activated chloride channel family protein
VVKRLVHSLGEGDSLELIAFGGTVWSWKPAAVRCSAAERAKAVAWLDTLRASGGTPMDEGIARALAGLRPEAQRQILLVTDGHIGFEQRIVGMIANGLGSSSRLHTLGVGGSTNRTLLRGAARVGRGIEAIVEPGDDVGPVLERVLRHLDRPQVVDLRLEGEAEVSPRQLPDLFAEAPARIAVKTKATRLRLVGRTAEGEWSQEIVVPTTREVRPALARLWAREAVEDAVTDGTLGQEVDGRIEALGLAWGIATRRTSFVAVSEEVTVDPTSPGRTVKVAHELPHELSAEGLGLRAVLPEVFGMSAPAAFAMPGSAPMPRMAPAPSTSGARGGAPSMRSAPKSRARDEMRESAPPTVFVQTSEEPPAPPSEAERADGMISRVWKRLRGQPAAPARPVRTLKARRVQPLGVDLGVDVQLDLATAWSLPAEVTVRLTDGRTVTCKLDVARSTRSGHLEAGAVLRLVLIGGAAARGDWRALVLDGLVVEL